MVLLKTILFFVSLGDLPIKIWFDKVENLSEKDLLATPFTDWFSVVYCLERDESFYGI